MRHDEGGISMQAIVELGFLGRSFATRGKGAEVRQRLVREATDCEAVVDFTGVAYVSYSFADEFIGRLATEHPEIHLETVGLEGDVERVVRRVLARRNELAASNC
jgi:hypothetical protein